MTLCLWEQREEQKTQGRQKPGFLHQRSSLNIHVFLLLTLHLLQAAVQTNAGYGQILNPFSKDGEQGRNVRKKAACFQRQLSKRQQMGSPAQAGPGPSNWEGHPLSVGSRWTPSIRLGPVGCSLGCPGCLSEAASCAHNTLSFPPAPALLTGSHLHRNPPLPPPGRSPCSVQLQDA